MFWCQVGGVVHQVGAFPPGLEVARNPVVLEGDDLAASVADAWHQVLGDVGPCPLDVAPAPPVGLAAHLAHCHHIPRVVHRC